MITAEEARKITNENMTGRAKKILDEIKGLITVEAERGGCEIFYDIDYSTPREVGYALRACGFSTEVFGKQLRIAW